MSASYAEICQELLKQAGNIRTMNSEILSKLLSQLMHFGRSAEENSSFKVRSVLARILRGNRSRIPNWAKLEKAAKKTRKVKKVTQASDLTPNSSVRTLRSTSTVDRSTSPFVKLVNIDNATNNVTKLQDSKMCLANMKKPNYPKVYLKNVLTTQGRISKSNFMEYFGLQASGIVPTVGPPNTPNGLIKLSQAVNIPLSSELGKLLLIKGNHVVLEDFKLRKINRAEWYINRTENVKTNGVHKRKTNSSTNPTTSTSSPPKRHPKLRKALQMKKENSLLKLCKPLQVNLKRIDLLATKRRLAHNARQRRKYWYFKNLRLCKELNVKVAIKEKAVVDKLLSKRKKKD